MLIYFLYCFRIAVVLVLYLSVRRPINVVIFIYCVLVSRI